MPFYDFYLSTYVNLVIEYITCIIHWTGINKASKDAVPKLYQERFNPLLTGYNLDPSSQYQIHTALLVKFLCQHITVPKNKYIPKKWTIRTAGWDSVALGNTLKKELYYTWLYPDVNMYINNNIYKIPKPQTTNIIRYEKKLTLDIFLKYMFIFCMILTPAFIFLGVNKTIGNMMR